MSEVDGQTKLGGDLAEFGKTRRERIKSALYLKLKKRKTFFLEKNLKFSKKFSFRKMSYKTEKCRRAPFLIYKQLQNNKKIKGGAFGDIINFRTKSRTVPKKIERGDSLVPSGFVGYLERVKSKRGTLCTKFALAHWPDLAP